MNSRKAIILMVLNFIFSAGLKSQSIKGYIINGNISSLKNSTIVYLIKSDKFGNADTVSIQKVQDGKFKFMGQLENEGEFYYIKIDTTHFKLPINRVPWIRLIMENSRCQIKGDVKNWPEVSISGFEENVKFDSLSIIENKMMAVTYNNIKKFKEDSILVSSEKKIYENKIIDLVNENKNLLCTSILILNSGISNSEFYKKAYELLSEKVKKSFYGVKLAEYIVNCDLQSKIRVGFQIPDFKVETLDGQKASILAIAKKGKLTLIDFWASWCKPCREEVPNLLKVYNSFHSYGFNILGISSDSNKDHWRKAISNDKTPWIHGIEFDTQVGEKIFGLQSIPAFILIDTDGKMLAFYRGISIVPTFGPPIRGKELYNTIEKFIATH